MCHVLWMFTGHLLCTGHFPCIVYCNPPNSNTGSGVVILPSQLRKRTLREVKDPFQWYTSGEAKVELMCLWFQSLCIKLDTFFLPTGSSQFLKCEGENQGTPTHLFARSYISQEPTNSIALMLNLHLPPAASPIEAGPMEERKSVKSGLSAPARDRDMTCEGCSFFSSPHPLQSRLHFKENIRLVELVKLQDKCYMFGFKPGLLSKKPSKHMTGKNLLLQAFTGTARGLRRLRKTFFSNLETQGYK